jgi:anhydro-N-acetylmuramic acid kinase
MDKMMRAIGLMSGTSMDGIDIALIETDGDTRVNRLGAVSVPYPEDFRQRLRSGLISAAQITAREQRPGDLAALERDLTQRHADAVLRFIGDRMLQPSAVDLIGFHGQTMLHRPERGLTVQLGDGALLAQLTGIDVAFDLRAADVAAGGQGAPLVPAYHRALAHKLPERPAAFLNLGGVANITYIGTNHRDEAAALVAFDTGPGNAMIDDWMFRHTGQPQDTDGAMARSGTVNETALRALLTHTFFSQGVPKSLDRNAFSPAPVASLSPADGAATLTAFTAAAVHRALAFLPEPPKYWVVCGGGRRNTTLMMALAERLEAVVAPVEAVGLDGDAMEAEAWAYLAVRSAKGLPLTYPRTTGVPYPQPGGQIAKATVE